MYDFPENGQIVFDDAQGIFDLTEAHFQVEVFDESLMKLVEIFIISREIGRVKNVDIFRDIVLRVQCFPQKPMHVISADF